MDKQINSSLYFSVYSIRRRERNSETINRNNFLVSRALLFFRIIFILLAGNASGFPTNLSALNLPAYFPRIVSFVETGKIIQPVFERKRVLRDDGRDANNMFKNITMVLENLLKNYENSQLPSHGKGEYKKSS